MNRSILAAAILAFLPSAFAAKPMVAMDEYHSNYVSPHYTYALGDNSPTGGFSKFAGILTSQNADTMSIHTPLDSAVLARIQVLIIVDPDTLPSKFIMPSEDSAVDAWVQQGGTLMMLANNKGKSEFTHYNQLAARFGIQFNGDTYDTSKKDLTPLPNLPFFVGCRIVHLKDISTLTVSPPATAVLTSTGKVLMASATKGLGKVFAVGDPWFYNEYINTQDNFKAATNVVQWLLLPNSTSIRADRRREMSLKALAGPGYLISGKRASVGEGWSWAQSVGIGVYHAPQPEAAPAP